MVRKRLFSFALRFIGCLLAFCWSYAVAAQTIKGTRTFTSAVAGVDGASATDMVMLDRELLYSLTAQAAQGIIATINAPGGKVVIKVYHSSSTATHLLWECSSLSTTATFGGTPDWVTPPNYLFGPVESMNSGTLTLNDFVNSYTPPGISSLKGKIPVVVEVTIQDASFKKAYIPGIGHYSLDFPWGHHCFGNTSEECEALREFKIGDHSKAVVTSHRGFWGYGDIPEGGMKSLRAAYDNKFLFVELDIMQSKDQYPLLLHDQEVNRMTNLPQTPDENEAGWIIKMNFNSTTDGTIPKRDGSGNYASYPPLKTGFLVDRRGEVTDDPIEQLSTALDYIKDKPIFIHLDIKDKFKSDYLLTTYLCLKLAKEKGVLHKMLFKPGSAAPVSRQEVQDYLTSPARPENLWSDYAYKSSSIVIILPTDVNNPHGDPTITDVDINSPDYGKIIWPNLKTRIDDWMKLPTVISFEVIYKCESQDPLLSPNVTPEHSTLFGGNSVVRYIKNGGYRMGINWEIPADCRGVPNGRGYWFDKSKKVNKPYLTYSPDCYDLRTNPEWMIDPPGYPEDIKPGSLVTDRPEVLVIMLNLLNRLSPATFRQ